MNDIVFIFLVFSLLYAALAVAVFYYPYRAIKSWNQQVATLAKFAFLFVNMIVLPGFGMGEGIIWSFLIGLYLYISTVQLLLGRLWTNWYCRRAIDTSILGFIVLVHAAFWGTDDCHIPKSMRETLSVAKIEDQKSFDVQMSYGLVSMYSNYLWLLENLGSFVVLPAGVVGLIGYAFERRKSNVVLKEKSAIESSAGAQFLLSTSATDAPTSIHDTGAGDASATVEAERSRSSLTVESLIGMCIVSAMAWVVASLCCSLLHFLALDGFTETVIFLIACWLIACIFSSFLQKSARPVYFPTLTLIIVLLLIGACGLKSMKPAILEALKEVVYAETPPQYHLDTKGLRSYLARY